MSAKVDAPIVLSHGEKIKIVVTYLLISLATILGFTASAIVGQISVVLAGLGLMTYIFGLRHGVDADHIAAIDNTTRKLMQENQRPFTVGLWFSLGHSTIVVALIVALVVATRTVVGSIPTLQSSGVIVGATVSGVFLWFIGIINLTVVLGLCRIFRALRGEELKRSELERLLDNRGFLNRYFRPLFKIVKRPWQIYPIGVLFGLGFDTASEIALIAISVGIGVSSAVPVWMILLLPFMFTCGMVLIDTTDGVAMRMAYGWAFVNPVRKIYYNITVTLISVFVALVIGTVELLQVVANKLSLSGPFWEWFGTLDFETIGFGIICLFLVSWLASVSYWKYKRFDQILVPTTKLAY